jgi:hypothetical protein
MRDRLVEVPDAVRQKAAARGAQGTRWLRGLLVMQVGAEHVGRQMLEVAHHWLQP